MNKASKNGFTESTVFALKALLILVGCFCAVFIIARFYLMITRVDGSSMYPTLEDEERIIVDKNIYKKHNPERFDIVVFETPISETGQYVKRIIALPGESVRIDEAGIIYINGEEIKESYGYEHILNPGRAIKDITLGENEYFVMGDNRNHSEDSRFMLVGNVSKDDILGKAIQRVWPIDKYGYIDLYIEKVRNDD
ncbi:signal peptidase I [Pseudobutyrivibrio sp.]|uniref:signal peptidase I n=1 Tax=Pseudobutyrivibrio sp. TaxID=2014367 RepID=UPI0025E3DFE8|nr:signal peptidase I [Pseudobutyrivibrio sp.]